MRDSGQRFPETGKLHLRLSINKLQRHILENILFAHHHPSQKKQIEEKLQFMDIYLFFFTPFYLSDV